jgi:hypothetical protein
MGLLDFFKKQPKELTEDEVRLLKEKEDYENRDIRGYCDSCGIIIEMGEGYTKQQGKYFHRKCWRDMLKQYGK